MQALRTPLGRASALLMAGWVAALSATDPPAARKVRFEPGAASDLRTARTPNGHLLVRPRINGRDLGWFIFDSGSSQHILSRDAARSAGLERVGETDVRSLTGSSREPWWRADTLRLGPAVFRGVRFAEMDLDGYSANAGVVIAGVLGYEVLLGTVVEFDYRGGRIAVHPPGAYAPASGRAVWHRLVSRTMRPRVRVGFEGREETMLVDTGATGTAMFYGHAVQRLGLLEDRPTARVFTQGLHGGACYQEGRLAWIDLGGLRFRNRKVLFSRAEDPAPALQAPAGLLGCELLLPFVVVFDYPAGRVGFVERAVPGVDPALLQEYAGEYRIPAGELRRVRAGPAGLATRRGEGAWHHLRPLSAAAFFYEDSLAWCEFLRDETGRVDRMLLHLPDRPPDPAWRQEDADPDPPGGVLATGSRAAARKRQ